MKMLTAEAAQPEHTPSSDEILHEFEDWLLDLVNLRGMTVGIGKNQYRACPIDLWILSQGFSWAWADAIDVIQAYRRVVNRLVDGGTDISAYQALAILNYVKTMYRYREV